MTHARTAAGPEEIDRGGRPPGTSGLPLLGNVVPLLRDPLAFLDGLAREHGDVARFRVLGDQVVLFSHPDAIEQLLVTERDKVIKDASTRMLSILLGNGLLVSEGAFWRKQRRLSQPAFHRQRVEAYGAVMVRDTERMAARFRSGETRDVHRDMMALTLDIVAETLFGMSLAEESRRIEQALSTLMDRFAGMGSVIPLGWPTPGNAKARKAIADLDAIVFDMIAKRRASGDTGDLLSMLIAATSDEDGADAGDRMTDRQLRDEAVTLLLAGHETTALTLTFTLYLLAKHPDVADALAAEIQEVLGDRPAQASDVPRLRLAGWIIQESMRLYPPAWAIGREAIAPVRLGGYDFPVGTQLWAAQWVVHRDARWYPEPLAFKPERWADDFAKKLPRQAYFPFGGGARICIGNAFAMMEAVLILVTLARSFRFRLEDDRPLRLAPSVTLRPRDGMRLSLEAR